MSRRPSDTFLPAALVLLCLAAFFLVFLPKTLVDEGPASLRSNFDLASYFLPRYRLGSEEMRLGHLPLWNRYEYGGIPLLGMAQPAVLYPPKILLFGVLEPVPALWVFLAAHYLLAAFGCLWFLREEGVRGAGLFVGTAVWIFGQPLLASNYHPVRIACLAWMPLLFVFGTRIAAGAGIGTFALLALVVAAQLLAGYPEFTIDIGLLLAVYVTVRWLQTRAAHPPWKTVPILAAAFALGAAAAGLQLVPLGEAAMVARRVAVAVTEVTKIDQVLASHGWTSIPVLPRSLYFTMDGVKSGELGMGEAPIAAISTLVVFALVGCWLRSARAAAVSYVVCQLIVGGAWHLLRLLPGFSMVRFPLTWTALALFCFAAVAALGSDAVLRPDGLGRRARRTALGAVVGASVALGVAALAAWRAAAGGGSGASKLATFFVNNIGGSTALILVLIAALLIAAFSLLDLFGLAPPEWAWLVAFTFAAVAHIASYPNGRAPASFTPPFPRGKVASMHGRPEAIRGRVLAPTDLNHGYEITDRLPSALGVEDSFLPWRWRQIAEELHFAAGFGVIDWNRIVAAHGFWNAMNVQFLLAPTSLTPDFAALGIRPESHSGEQTLFENPLRLGEAWVTYAVHPIASGREALEYVTSRRFDPYREVVLEDRTRHQYPTTTDEPVTIPSAGTRSSSTDVEFDVDLPRPGLFVVSESAYPGFIATVDGARQSWLTADYVLRAIELEPGMHRVRFEYRPASVRWGAALSGLGFSGIAGLLLVAHRRRSAAQPSA